MKVRLRPVSVLFYLALLLSVRTSGIQAQEAKSSQDKSSSITSVKQQNDPDLIGPHYDNKYGHSGEQGLKDFYGSLVSGKKSVINSGGENKGLNKIGEVGTNDGFQGGVGEGGNKVRKNFGNKVTKSSLKVRLYSGVNSSLVPAKNELAGAKKKIPKLKSIARGGLWGKLGGTVMSYLDPASKAAGQVAGGQYKDSVKTVASGFSRAYWVNSVGGLGVAGATAVVGPAAAATVTGGALIVVAAVGTSWLAGEAWDTTVAVGPGIVKKVGGMIATHIDLNGPPSTTPSSYRGGSILESDTLVLSSPESIYTDNSPSGDNKKPLNIIFVSKDTGKIFPAGDLVKTLPDVKVAVTGVDPKPSFDNALPFDDKFDIGGALKGVETLVSKSGGKEENSDAGETITEKLQTDVKNELAQEVTGTLQAGAKNEVNAENKAKQKAVRSTSRRVSSSGSSSSRSSSGRSGGRRVTQPTKHVCGPRCNH